MQESESVPFFQSQRKLTDNMEMQNQMVRGASKADVHLGEGICTVRRYKHPFISLQFSHGEMIYLLKLMSTKIISGNFMGLHVKDDISQQA